MKAKPGTLGELRQSHFSEERYRNRTVKDELRENLICRLDRGDRLFPGIVGFDDTVIPQVVNAVRYYDAVNFAARTKAPGFFTVGFIDTTCPPSSVYAAYNALRSRKEIFHDIAAGHTNTPAASAAMREAVKRHFAAMR